MNLLFEDDLLLAVEKPPLLHTIGSGSSVASLEALLVTRWPTLSALPEAGLLQRLDFETAGIILVAKTAQSLLRLQEALQAPDVQKRYLCILGGCFANDTVLARCYLGSRYRHSKKVSTSTTAKPRYQLRETSFAPLVRTTNYSLVRATLSHGYRHQVRVHAAHIGLPLLGDSLYGSSSSLQELEAFCNFPAPHALFAESVSFCHPQSGRAVTLSAPPPAAFQVLG